MTDYIVPLILLMSMALALGKKENAYDHMLRGAAQGLRLIVSILPALILLLSAVHMLQPHLYAGGCVGGDRESAGFPGLLRPVADSTERVGVSQRCELHPLGKTKIFTKQRFRNHDGFGNVAFLQFS